MAIKIISGTLSNDSGSSVSVAASITSNGLDSRKLSITYEELFLSYEQLGTNIKYSLNAILKKNNIEYFSIDMRVKDFDSFWEKCIRKSYSDPFEDTEDMCGIRIILHNIADLEKVGKIIRREFKIQKFEDKYDAKGDSPFGYNSHHYIVTLKNVWTRTPLFKGLQNLKAEIQLRTILMHAWSNISHKFVYKNEENVPLEIRRELNLISAKLGEIDTQLQKISNVANKLPRNAQTKFVKKKSKYAPAVSIKKT